MVNQPIPGKPGEQPRRRLLNMRAVDDAAVAAIKGEKLQDWVESAILDKLAREEAEV